MAGQGDEETNTKLLVRWGLLNLLLSVLGLVIIFWIVGEQARIIGLATEEEERRAELCNQKVIRSMEPPVLDPKSDAPPQDKAKSGYVGRYGVDIRPALRLNLEVVRDLAREEPEKILFGSQEALPSNTIHIVNLWATYCGPCQDEMPDFKALLARRSDWGDSVRFVPIELEDDTSPVKAYRDMAKILPTAPVKLADRAYGRPLASALEESGVFKKNLPVTLVLDCNRRVRWAQFEQLSSLDFAELESFIDQFLAELADESPGSRCVKDWEGNGRCEGKERLPGSHVLEDCGPLRKRVESGSDSNVPDEPASFQVVPPEPPPPPKCPPGEILTRGKCQRKAKLSGVGGEAKPSLPITCGDGVCSAGESKSTCCDCLQCPPPLVCGLSNGTPLCRVKNLK